MKVRFLAVTFGVFLAMGDAHAGPMPGGPDSDRDGVEDAFDNCVSVANASQVDSNHDGCGDACTQTITCDFNGDKAVGSLDFLILRTHFGMNVMQPGTLGDCKPGDGGAGTTDFAKLRFEFGHQVGPSGITTEQCDPSSCRCTPQ